MANANIVVLAGNLVRDPEIKQLPSGKSLAALRMAVNRKFKDGQTGEWRDEATFVDVDLFGRQAEIAQQYLAKGRPVLIEGRLRMNEWEDKQSGQKRSKLSIVANRFHFLGGQGGGARYQNYDDNNRDSKSTPAAAPVGVGDVAQEDMPF